MMPQEQYTHHRSTMPSSEGPQVYKVGIYGWRKRCLYFFVLLLMILILVNLAMTIWILKVMNFTIDGMGNLRITEKGLKLEGDSEFLQPLYAKEIQSRPGNALYFKSARNVTVNILNDQTKVLTQLITGPKAVEAYGQKFEVKTVSGKLLFSADNNEVVVGAERLRVLGAEGTVFPKSIETPNVRADPFKELRLESPTRSLVMEAPKGVEINAEAGNLEATCRTELRLESKDGEVGGEKDMSPKRYSSNWPTFPQTALLLPLPLTLVLHCTHKRCHSEGFISGTNTLNKMTISQTHNP
ncbi:PREDICTED: delta-sarcoglycan isoform X3 [Hipposideros armiger]|uniref:Delta-sarcoglycan isoform X3 n=1 Tax=Hipposideros armiger TaxID=186990 RepID=A0A8B7SAB3_HIPAR|nr:PREDICTED: delta-sarcoglycan isoform X3 [Hipposideros armiger]